MAVNDGPGSASSLSPYDLNAHTKPPESLKRWFKQYQKEWGANDSGESIHPDGHNLTLTGRKISSSDLEQACNEFLGRPMSQGPGFVCQDVFIYEARELPGLFIYRSLLPLPAQRELLNRLLHRDLSNPAHKTNLHLHYKMPYSGQTSSSEKGNESLFHLPPSTTLLPIDTILHNPLTLQTALSRKLRWLTLGGQYDWTFKRYPPFPPLKFPPDIARFLLTLFPFVTPQAAIVNLYSPGDTLSLHRDVSEYCARPLVSLSIGCDAIFVVGSERADGTTPSMALRLRSGDAVVMEGKARWAWHGVPTVVAGTCPEELRDWPGGGTRQAGNEWEGWLAGKRINLNVRQMND